MTALLLKGERLQVWLVGETYYLHTNGRCIGVDRTQAEAFHEGLGAILRGETTNALTPDMVEQPREASGRESEPIVRPRVKAFVPNLEDL